MTAARTSLLLLALLAIASAVAARRHIYRDNGFGGTHFQRLGHPGAANCTERWFWQDVDHYSFGQPSGQVNMTYWQRYLTYDKYYKPGGPIFFYAGNEGPITIFADIAGLMWQNAEQFGAAIVFAEHRFYGKSQPCTVMADCRQHLSTMQAMADYAVLLTYLQSPHGRYAKSKGVITFGGSYGGMLSSYMRIKYPNIVTGSIASSGPVVMVSESYNTDLYWQVITRDATSAGGSAAHCAHNVYKAIQATFALFDAPGGAAQATKLFKSCTPFPSGEAGKNQVGYFIQAAFDLFGMGDYPMPIDFMFGTPDHPAPAYPMRVACENLKEASYPDNTTLVEQLVKAVSVMYNVTQNEKCFETNTNPTSGGTWDYMVCSEHVFNEIPYFTSKGWPSDMFWPQEKWTHARYKEHCMKHYNVTTRWGWLNTTYGGGNVGGATNIVYANGLLDPWHSGGILHNVSDTVRSYIIPGGAHHLDLLFTCDNDPPAVQWVRAEEMRHVKKWLDAL